MILLLLDLACFQQTSVGNRCAGSQISVGGGSGTRLLPSGGADKLIRPAASAPFHWGRDAARPYRILAQMTTPP